MNRQYSDGGLSGMNAFTALRFISVQSNAPLFNGSTIRFFDILVYICEAKTKLFVKAYTCTI